MALDSALTAEASITPGTSWTRQDWVRTFAGLTAAFARASEGRSPAWPALPGAAAEDRICGLEGFARMSVAWGAWLGLPSNPLVIAADGAGSQGVDILETLVRGLSDGTDPASPWWWGPVGDRDQRIVEAAELATGLWMGRDRLVPALGGERLDRVLDWIGAVEGRDVYPDNWVLFPSFVATVQRGLGRPVPDAAIDRGLDVMLAGYRGDGWYADGQGNAFDQYTGWAVHWHLLLWSRIDGDRRPRLRSLIERRARTYLQGILPLFAADGRRPLQGRSLGYRFAAVAPFALAALLDLGAVEPGLARRIASDAIARHLEDGALDPVTGWFRRGVAGERPDVCERYMSAGAAAWAAHAFVALGLPAGAPFWTAPPRTVPVEGSDELVALRGPGFLLGRRRATGETWLLNAVAGHPEDIPGHDYTPAYGKFAYRSHFPFTVQTSEGRPAPDDAVVFSAGDASSHRGETEAGGAGPAMTWSRYHVAVGGRQHGATTVILPWRDVEVRLTGVRPDGPVRLSEGTAALASERDEPITRRSWDDADWASASTPRRSVAIRRLLGYDGLRPSGPGATGPDRNLVADHSEQPTVFETRPSARPRVVATVTMAVAAGALDLADLLAIEAEAVGLGLAHVTFGTEERAVVVLGARTLGHLETHGWIVDGPGIRAFRMRTDGTGFTGERVTSVQGVIRLDRPAPVSVRRIEGPAVQVTVDTGFVLDRAWTGFDPCSVEVRDGVGAWMPVGPLERPGVVPGRLIRAIRRRTGRTLVDLRLRP